MKYFRVLAVAILGFFISTTSFSQSSQPDLSSYVATFKMADNEYCKKIIISLKEGKLFGSTDVNPADGVILTPTKEVDKFTTTIQGNDAEITFSRVDGKISAIKLSAGGGQVVLTGDKEMAAPSSLTDYVATFKMGDNPYVKEVMIALKEGKLMLSSDASPTEGIELIAAKDADSFTASIQGNDAEISFSRVEGKVTKIKISVGGGQLILTGDKL